MSFVPRVSFTYVRIIKRSLNLPVVCAISRSEKVQETAVPTSDSQTAAVTNSTEPQRQQEEEITSTTNESTLVSQPDADFPVCLL